MARNRKLKQTKRSLQWFSISDCHFVCILVGNPAGGSFIYFRHNVLGNKNKKKQKRTNQLLGLLYICGVEGGDEWVDGWMGGWGGGGGEGGRERGVKIKSKENESPSPHSRSGYKYIHVDARVRARIRFSARGWHYISRSVGGVMRGMYNSSVRDSTGGVLERGSHAHQAHPLLKRIPQCWGFIYLFIYLLIHLFIYFPPARQVSVSGGGECKVTDGQQASSCGAGQLWKMTGRVREIRSSQQRSRSGMCQGKNQTTKRSSAPRVRGRSRRTSNTAVSVFFPPNSGCDITETSGPLTFDLW